MIGLSLALFSSFSIYERSHGSAAPVLFAIGYALAVVALAGPAFRQLPEQLARSESAHVSSISTDTAVSKPAAERPQSMPPPPENKLMT